MTAFSTIAWIMTCILMIYNVRNMRPWTLRRSLKPRLREQAFHLIAESSDLSDMDKHIGVGQLAREKRLEQLRLYARCADKYKVEDLSSLIESIRLEKLFLRTNMRSDKLTVEQLAVYFKFVEIRNELASHTHLGQKDYQKLRLQIVRTAFYAMTHLGKADHLLSIMQERSIYQLSEIKKLKKDMDALPTGALSEGML